MSKDTKRPWRRPRDCHPAIPAIALLLTTLRLSPVAAQDGNGMEDLTEFSFEELMDIEITSVRKKSEKLMDAAAAIHVITAEDMRRAGLESIPEALRLVPGMQVARIDGNKWAISARGFNGRFANKLLVLVDGRSVYTPLFSGVYWEVLNTLIPDLDRIEVIRGPGGTLWGANAVNGVINIITKRAEDAQGALSSVGTGTEDYFTGSARYGGQLSDDLFYRVYSQYFTRDGGVDADGHNTADDWSGIHGGFRIDWDADDRDSFSFIGDAHYVRAGVEYGLPTLVPPYLNEIEDNMDANGQSLVGRWTRMLSEGSELVMQAYYLREDRQEYEYETMRDTIDIDGQHRFDLSEIQEVLWGLNYRVDFQEYNPGGLIQADHSHYVHQLASLFFQDDITIVPDALRATIGSKFDYNTHTKFEVQPSFRLLWTPHERHRAWASVSRAVRTPSTGEEDGPIGLETVPAVPPFVPPTLVQVRGNQNLDSEDLLAVEIGYRTQPVDEISIDLAAFYNRYDDITTLEPLTPAVDPGPPLHAVQPLRWENRAEADTFGVEIASSWRVLEWWSLMGTFTFLTLDVHRDGDSSDFLGRENHEPKHQATLRSSMDLPWGLELDSFLFYADHLANVKSYARLDVRLGWRPYQDDRLEVSVGARNLTDSQHPEAFREFRETPVELQRSFYVNLVVRF